MQSLGYADCTLPDIYDAWYESAIVGFPSGYVVTLGDLETGGFTQYTLVLRCFNAANISAPYSRVDVNMTALDTGGNGGQLYGFTVTRMDDTRAMVAFRFGSLYYAVAFSCVSGVLSVGTPVRLDAARPDGTSAYGTFFPVNNTNSAYTYGTFAGQNYERSIATLSDGSVAFVGWAYFYPATGGSLDRFMGVRFSLSGLQITVGSWYWLEPANTFLSDRYEITETALGDGMVTRHRIFRNNSAQTSPSNEIDVVDWTVTPPVMSEQVGSASDLGFLTRIDSKPYRVIDHPGTQTTATSTATISNLSVVTPDISLVPDFYAYGPEGSYVDEVLPTQTRAGGMFALGQFGPDYLTDVLVEYLGTGALRLPTSTVDLSGRTERCLGTSTAVAGGYGIALTDWEQPIAPVYRKISRIQAYSFNDRVPVLRTTAQDSASQFVRPGAPSPILVS